MKQVVLAILALVVVGCGRGPNSLPQDVEPYYVALVADANAHGWDVDYNEDITVVFAGLGDVKNGKEIGFCTEVDGKPHIALDPMFWKYADGDSRKILIYHELGHCLLRKGHVRDKNNIMYPSIQEPVDAYKLHPAESIDGLFVK